MEIKIWTLSDNRGYFLENEEELAKNFCKVYGGTYHEDALAVCEPENDEQ